MRSAEPHNTLALAFFRHNRDMTYRILVVEDSLETTRKTGLKHVDGAISMARDGPDTATSDFFICVGPQPELDFAGKRNPDGQGFAAFGRVVNGMDIVRKIQTAPSKGQKLIPPVKIMKIERIAD